MVSDFFLKRLPPNYEQPYALFVSIIDPSWDINLRELMLQQTEVFEVIQPIQIPIQTAV
jgi:hypothetical protein